MRKIVIEVPNVCFDRKNFRDKCNHFMYFDCHCELFNSNCGKKNEGIVKPCKECLNAERG